MPNLKNCQSHWTLMNRLLMKDGLAMIIQVEKGNHGCDNYKEKKKKGNYTQANGKNLSEHLYVYIQKETSHLPPINLELSLFSVHTHCRTCSDVLPLSFLQLTVHGPCIQGSPSICMGNRLLVIMVTLLHWASLLPECRRPVFTWPMCKQFSKPITSMRLSPMSAKEWVVIIGTGS